VTTIEHYRPDFRFSDLVAGYVVGHDPDRGLVEVRTSDGRMVRVEYRDGVGCELLRNLGEPYQDAGGRLDELLVEGRALFAYGVFSPVGDGYWFEARRLLFLARDDEPYAFEAADWWPTQLAELGRFYRRAQFGDGPVDFADYRTEVRLGGIKKSDRYVQETDTVSRMVYGMAAAYMLTGDEDFLDVAESGSTYLREHMRFVDADDDVVYWYHGIDVRDGVESKLFASEFSDDYRAIPAYEQIYALAGLTQTYRLTGDPGILADIEGTLRLFATFFHDDERGGWYSHVDPIRLSPHHESLGANRARKNWNSVGDHPPAYLINLFLATGQRRHADMLEECFDLIAERLPDPASPFVQERFHADWTPDRTWGWQQDRAVVGHNLKIAWNLTRMNSIRPKASYRKLADHLGRTMPMVGSDTQRGGWFDVVERQPTEGTGWHRLVWHDRKAWWQQEQAILAYLILAGCTDDEAFLKHAREAAGFYNAFFLDHDDGGVYFNVLADGVPYLLGTERQKGSHAMSMYHNAELCLLATVYERLLLRGEPLELWFRPAADGFGEDRVLRVAPDALPPGRIRLESVELDGSPWTKFDPVAMAVHLPESESALTVRVRLRPEG
jgi:mannose/cellobiose epimerase-like protein (N-acyl-D-glucosamine 2-epimerase family)